MPAPMSTLSPVPYDIMSYIPTGEGLNDHEKKRIRSDRTDYNEAALSEVITYKSKIAGYDELVKHLRAKLEHATNVTSTCYASAFVLI